MATRFTPEMLAAENAKLLPGQWLDFLPEPLETVEDVQDLMCRVDALKAKREAIERAFRN
jgi:hypothetical protein